MEPELKVCRFEATGRKPVIMSGAADQALTITLFHPA